jgi:hypothetical protein
MCGSGTSDGTEKTRLPGEENMFRRVGFLMNQAGDPPPGGTPAAAATPPVTPPAAQPPVAAPATDLNNPPWLAERLERERRAALADLGITDPAKAKKLLEDAAKAEDEKKTQGERLGETSKALETERARAQRYEAVIKERAASEIGILTPEQQAAVRKIAPDTDPAAQLSAITALAPTWRAAAPAVPPAAAASVVTPPAPPASGTAPPNGPPQGGSVSTPDRKAEYIALKAKNPHAAALFLNQHHAAIYPPTS